MAAPGDDGRGLDHVFAIMMENTGEDTLIGNQNAPFINFPAVTTGLADKLLRWGASQSRQSTAS